MTYGPSTNRLMTAEEYARLDRIRAHAMLSSVERTCPAWTDTTTPRTDAPVRFIPRTRHPALLAREGFNPGSFTIRWA